MARLFAGTPFDIPPTCDRCQRPEQECECPDLPPAKKLIPPEQQTATVTVEKRKKGKVVTVVKQLAAAGNDLPALCTVLKNDCGAGGTVAGDTIEIQGQHAQRISEKLNSLGYNVKIANPAVKKA